MISELLITGVNFRLNLGLPIEAAIMFLNNDMIVYLVSRIQLIVVYRKMLKFNDYYAYDIFKVCMSERFFVL